MNPDAALPKRETLLNREKKESCCNPFSYSASALESRFLKLILVGGFACASCMGDVFYYVFDALAIIIPHICHGRADGVRVNFFWPV